MNNLMTGSDLINQLQDRGLIVQLTDKNNLSFLLSKGPISLYCGFDPTADSLHLGHLIPLLCLKYFQQAGHKPIILIGGATSLIGDPSFKKDQRPFYEKKTIKKWIEKICKQISLFLNFDCGENMAIITNNYDWFSKMNVLTFLRQIGKYFSVNQMINKEAVKLRMQRDDKGISFTEFSYNLLQGYDFAYLNKTYDVILQIGGSDQWGNIVSGIDLTRRLYKNHVFGLTVPLITKADGTKFGKTENDVIWLDPEKTSPYKLYQFWINIPDADIYRFLRLFTLIDVTEIKAMEYDHKNNNNGIPRAKYILAEKVVELIHGKNALESAKRISLCLFNKKISNLIESDFKQLAQDGVHTIKVKKNAKLIQVLIDCLLYSSFSKARKAIVSNAISVNGKRESNPEYVFSEDDYLFGSYTLLQRGRKNFCLIYWI